MNPKETLLSGISTTKERARSPQQGSIKVVKKQAEKKEPFVPFQFNIPKSLHKELKIKAINDDTSIRELILGYIIAGLDKDKAKANKSSNT